MAMDFDRFSKRQLQHYYVNSMRPVLDKKALYSDTTEEYIPDEKIQENPRRTTKWSGDRQSTRKRIQSSDNKGDPRSWRKDEGTDQEDTGNF